MTLLPLRLLCLLGNAQRVQRNDASSNLHCSATPSVLDDLQHVLTVARDACNPKHASVSIDVGIHGVTVDATSNTSHVTPHLALPLFSFGHVGQQIPRLAVERGTQSFEHGHVDALNLATFEQPVCDWRGDARESRELRRVQNLSRFHMAVQRPTDHGRTVAYYGMVDKGRTLAYYSGIPFQECMPMVVTQMAVRERPAHRARHVGVNAMATAELLTLALGLSDSSVAESILAKSGGSLRRLAGSVDRLDEKGVGPQKRAVLSAIFEIGRRFCSEAREDNTPVRSPRDVVAVMAGRMEDLPVEEFHVLVLDAQHRMERDITVTRGILNSSLVHPREVFREAIAERAAAVILVHNHPSGDPAPSADDRAVTDQLVAAGPLLDIPVHDHVIIGRGRYTSFAEAGLL